MSLLEINQLVKHFHGVKAVDGVSFSIEQGRCFGLLGPNGAGKTTTVEMLEGISEPTSGGILYRGEPLGKTFRNQAGIMFQSTAIQEFITVRETLELFQHFYPQSYDLDDLAALCDLQEFLDRDTRRISGGQKQRLLLAIALVNKPEILFLDEPTTGLDPQARRRFWALINSIKQQNKTIVLTTHYMEEAYELCDDIAIMDHGHIIAMGTPRALLAEHFNDVVLQLPADVDLEGLSHLDGLDIIRHDGMLELRTGDTDRAIRSLLEHQVPLQGLQIRERTLEDLFLELTGKELRS
jgi:ABC-2 type transport system ATP-binding protein